MAAAPSSWSSPPSSKATISAIFSIAPGGEKTLKRSEGPFCRGDGVQVGEFTLISCANAQIGRKVCLRHTNETPTMPCGKEATSLSWAGIESKIQGNLIKGKYLTSPELAKTLMGYPTMDDFRRMSLELSCKAQSSDIKTLSERITDELASLSESFEGPSPAPPAQGEPIMSENLIRNLRASGDALTLSHSPDLNTLILESTAPTQTQVTASLLVKAEKADLERFTTETNLRLTGHDTQLALLDGITKEASKLSTISVQVNSFSQRLDSAQAVASQETQAVDLRVSALSDVVISKNGVLTAALEAAKLKENTDIHNLNVRIDTLPSNGGGSAGGGGGGGSQFQPHTLISCTFQGVLRESKNEGLFDFLDQDVGFINCGSTTAARTLSTFRTPSPDEFAAFRQVEASKSARAWLATLHGSFSQAQGLLTVPSLQTLPGSGHQPANPFFFLPLAQCWGGSVKGHLEVSFYVLRPAASPGGHALKLTIFHGYPGRQSTEDPGPVMTSRQPGDPAPEIIGMGFDGDPDLTITLRTDNGVGNMVSSPFQRFRVPISYTRRAPHQPGAIDNQYFGALYAPHHDAQLAITDLSISLVASAATDAILSGWPGLEVPPSLNS